LLALPAARAQLKTADDYFNGGAQSYISNSVPKALEIVTNGRALYPDDIKLKKLEDLLKQQQQQQQQQNQKNQQQQNQQQQNQSQQSKDQQQQQQQQNQSGNQQKQEQGSGQQQQAEMTPAEAERLLDSQKGEESALVFKPAARPEDQNRKFKDW
jgi:Ca-activated chloride channel family protein